MPFSASSNEIHLVKMRLPFDGVNIPICDKFVWRQLGVCVFRCADFGWRTFYIVRRKTMDQKTLFTTKGLYNITGFCIAWVILVIFSCIMYAYSSASALIMLLLSFALAIPFMNTLNLNRSYIELHEDKLMGKTIAKLFSTAISFEFSYKDIQSVTHKENIVILCVNNQTYEVQAKNCEKQVVEIIKNHMQPNL